MQLECQIVVHFLVINPRSGSLYIMDYSDIYLYTSIEYQIQPWPQLLSALRGLLNDSHFYYNHIKVSIIETVLSVKTAVLLSNVIDADHPNSCLFTNKGHFSSPLWILSGVLAQFHE